MVVGPKVSIIPAREPLRGAAAAICYDRGMWIATLALAALLAGPGPRHFEVTASYTPAARRQGTVLVTFKALDPDVVVNEQPSPRLALDPAQKVLVDKQPPPAKTAPPDPADGKYLDLSLPIAFPVAVSQGVAAGTQAVAGKVTYFYCSKREGWCRKGTSELDLSVKVP
jgi:hypothetical protein